MLVGSRSSSSGGGGCGGGSGGGSGGGGTNSANAVDLRDTGSEESVSRRSFGGTDRMRVRDRSAPLMWDA